VRGSVKVEHCQYKVRGSLNQGLGLVGQGQTTQSGCGQNNGCPSWFVHGTSLSPCAIGLSTLSRPDRLCAKPLVAIVLSIGRVTPRESKSFVSSAAVPQLGMSRRTGGGGKPLGKVRCTCRASSKSLLSKRQQCRASQRQLILNNCACGLTRLV